MKKILNIYKKFLLIRYTDEEIARKYGEWKMRCPTHLSVGQEMVSACLEECFKKKDAAVSSHRAHAHYLGKGGNLNRMIAEIYGKETGCSKGKGGSMHLIDTKCGFLGSTAIVGNSIPVGVGHALNFKINKKKNISLIFFGDAGIETGIFYESLNFAILKNLPSIFICENNFYSVYTPLNQRQSTKLNISKRISGLGIKTIRVDSFNWKKVIKTLEYSRKFVNEKKQPIFLEFLTYRKYEHVGHLKDDHLKYRSQKEIKYWKGRDPLILIRKYLLKNRITQSSIDKINKEVMLKIKKAFRFAENSKFPNPNDYKLHIFKNKI
tara:strand:+ start:125 stop:1090 length:966 start_codon:yes stop_codon:yes gene_type:complete